MSTVTQMQNFTQDEFFPLDMTIVGISVDRKYPDGENLNSYSGRLTVELDEYPELRFSFEWLAYHKDSSQQFIKTDPLWFYPVGDWHFSLNGRYGEINMVGFQLIDEDTEEPLSESAQQHFVHSVFTENYAWKQNVHAALMRHING